MTAKPKHSGLATALGAVMTGRDRSKRAWQLVQSVMAQEIRARRYQHQLDDVQQEVAMKLLSARNPFSGDSDAAAYAYIRRVTNHAVIDRARREMLRPQPISWRTGDQDPLERVAAPMPDTNGLDDLEATADELLDRLLAEVDLLVEQSGKPAATRELSRLSAHARLLSRVHGMATLEIAQQLGRPDVSKACIEKWVERGLPLLSQALDRFTSGAEPSQLRVIEQLRAALERRRTDAGKPRPPQGKRGKASK